MRYRPEIDGLRALAIVLVVFYHAKVSIFAGGYVGVDIFFVISGFLITSLILPEIDTGQFSLVAFYERRVRRIFPALFFLIFISAIAAWILLTPQDLKQFGKSVIAAVAFYSNFLFRWDAVAGYFNTPAATKPLFHSWSLSIEEQFYLVFPLYLFLITRIVPKHRAAATLALAALSLLVNVIRVYDHPIGTFFLPFTRAWELALGALLAFGEFKPPSSATAASFATLLGLGCIAFSVFVYTGRTFYPGIDAVVPTAGAALCVWGSAKSFVNRALANTPMVFVGKISYSLYLWHFVLFSFGGYLSVRGMTSAETVVLIVMSFALAIWSWHYIEQPFRERKKSFFTRRQLFLASAAAMAVFVCFGLFAVKTDGMAGRSRLPAMTATLTALGSPIKTCLTFDFQDPRTCPIGATQPDPQFIVWGDSHADAIRFAVVEALAAVPSKMKGGLLVGALACMPSLGIDVSLNTYCRGVNDNLLAYVRGATSIKLVVLVARWALYSEGVDVDGRTRVALGNNGTQRRFTLPNSDRSEVLANNRRFFAEGLERLIKALRDAGKKIWIVDAVPELPFNPDKIIYLMKLGVVTPITGFDSRDFIRRQSFVEPAIQDIATRYHIGIIHPSDRLCRDGQCIYVSGGQSLYSDSNHLTVAGDAYVAPIFTHILR